VISKKLPYLLLLLVSVMISFSQTIFAHSQIKDTANNLNYSISFGYGTSNFYINNKSNSAITLKSLSFDYASDTLPLPSWGAFADAQVSKQLIAGNLYHYTLTFNNTDAATPGSIPANGNIQIDQLPLGNPSDPGTTPTPDYQGFPSNVSVVLTDGSSTNLAIDGICQGSACTDPGKGKVLSAYFTNWSVYGGHGNFSPASLPIQNLNTIFYAIGKIHPDTGGVASVDPWADVGKYTIPNLTLLKQKNPYLSLSMSYGGWGCISCNNFPSGDLAVLFTYYPKNIPTIAKNMVTTMLQYGFNGIDIDYEWTAPFQPQTPGGQAPLAIQDSSNPSFYNTAPLSQQTADGYAELIYDIRQELNKLTPPTGQPPYQLSVALYAGIDKINELNSFKNAQHNNDSDLKIILDNISHVDLMTYDFHGGFDASPAGQQSSDSISNFQSQFSMSSTDPTQNTAVKQYDVIDSVKALKNADPNDANFPDSKIVVGVPAYSRIERITALPNNPSAAQQQGVYVPLASTDQQAQMNTDVAGEYGGDYLYQTLTGGSNLVGSATVDYKCIVQFPADASSSSCYYSSNSGSHPLPSDMQLFAMNSLPTAGQVGYEAATPWGYGASTHSFMSFDNNLSAANKAQYVLNQKLGGVMIWEVDGDIPPTDANYQSKSLIYAIYKTFNN
jgi:GH18 family chitinase